MGNRPATRPGSQNVTDRTTFLVHCVGVRSSVVAAEALALLFSCSIGPERSRELVRAVCPERRAEEQTMHATIRRYEGVDTARTEELTRKVSETLVPQLEKLEGFRG